MKLSNGKNYPKFEKHIQAGWDDAENRFRDRSGNRISKANYLETQISAYGVTGESRISARDLTPVSNSMEKLEDVIGANLSTTYKKGGIWDAFAAVSNRAWPIPRDVLAAMRLSEYFYRTEGDIAHALSIPREVMFASEYTVNSPSLEIKRQLEELYGQDQLDLFGLFKDMYDAEAVYGNVFPMLLPSGDPAEPLSGITLLNPKYVYCGTPLSLFSASGAPPSSKESLFSQFGIMSQTEKIWTEQALANEIHPIAYNAFGSQWNEQVNRSLWIDINPRFIRPIQINKQRWERYAMPQLSKTFRSITTRKMFEELRRATAEGYKSQLFIFNVGTKDQLGSLEELTIYRGLLDSLNPERSGMLLGRGNFSGEVLHMDQLEDLLANETWHNLTLSIFRNLGINLRFISGESASQGSAHAASDLDIMIFVERLAFRQKIFQRWENWFRMTLAELLAPKDDALKKVMRETTITWQKPMMEMATQMKAYLMPLFTIGAMSIRTLHEKSQLNHEAEVANRQQEQKEGLDELFMPRTTFVQQAVNPEGDTQQTASEPSHTNEAKPTAKNTVKKARTGVKAQVEEQDYADFLGPY